jgi:DNA modification methylase
MKATIIIGDARQALKSLDEKSVQTCITSPPYWGLRDYGVDSQIGLEQSPDEYVAEIVNVFREVWRVLRDDGTLWLNIGDSYASARDSKAVPDSLRSGDGTAVGKAANRNPANLKKAGLKHKDLAGIPWMVAFALRADGWYLRQDIIWAKPNPMPESVTDRCTKSHEYVFLLTKSPKYYFDNLQIQEIATGYDGRKDTLLKGSPKYANKTIVPGQSGQSFASTPHERWNFVDGIPMRNKRSVWTVNTKPFQGAHFAVMPEALVEPSVLAGTPLGGCCSKCRTPYQRQLELGEISERTTRVDTLNVIPGRDKPSRLQSTNMETIPKKTIGWLQACDCEGSKPQPSLVLDPFTGSGTVGVVALNNNCDFIGTELNPEYAKIAEKRIYENNPMFDNVEIK